MSQGNFRSRSTHLLVVGRTDFYHQSDKLVKTSKMSTSYAYECSFDAALDLNDSSLPGRRPQSS
eukprot:733296-Hanusia_phi.AAC.1